MALHQEIVVVSGLPRSGTSLMMQMLDQGGIPALTDHRRTPDVDNPRGYYEFEAVKRTKHDSSWVADARGKAVKMVSSLLYDLPDTEQYRVIIQSRNFDEMLDSQEKMLQRLGQPAAPRDAIRRSYEKHLNKLEDWLASQSQIRTLFVSYNEILDDPQKQIERLVDFLDGAPSAIKMLEAIDPSLYRNRIK
ncbi:MAG: sulfotransferase domain-containing protein [Planctomycetaceae bacterium]|nr:sulfotransferase domain-containing protein [Planctomycetaceae bacterium]